MGAKKITHLTFIDIETTALVGPRVKPYVDQIVEVCVARVNLQTRQIDDWYETLIRPEGQDQTIPLLDSHGGPVDWTQIHRSEYRWNLGKYHLDRGTFRHVIPELWQACPPMSQVLEELRPLLQGAILAGNNPGFDRDHIMRDYQNHQGCLTPPELDYHLVDLATPAVMLTALGVCEGASLRHLRAWAGLPGEQEHRAGQDVKDAIQVFWKIVDLMQAGIHYMAWEAGRPPTPEEDQEDGDDA